MGFYNEPCGKMFRISRWIFMKYQILQSARRAPVGWCLIALACLGALPATAQRQMEQLGRGLIVLRSSSTQIYIGWRLLGNDPSDIAFNLYRAANAGVPVKINPAPLVNITDYVDTPPSLGATAYT